MERWMDTRFLSLYVYLLIEAKVMKAKKNYGYAKLLDILTPSEGRERYPGCAIARKCGGGGQIQEMKYDWQLRFKEEKSGALWRGLGRCRRSFLRK